MKDRAPQLQIRIRARTRTRKGSQTRDLRNVELRKRNSCLGSSRIVLYGGFLYSFFSYPKLIFLCIAYRSDIRSRYHVSASYFCIWYLAESSVSSATRSPLKLRHAHFPLQLDANSVNPHKISQTSLVPCCFDSRSTSFLPTVIHLQNFLQCVSPGAFPSLKLHSVISVGIRPDGKVFSNPIVHLWWWTEPQRH